MQTRGNNHKWHRHRKYRVLYELSTSLNLMERRKNRPPSLAAKDRCNLSSCMVLDSVVAGISTLGPIVSWLFGDIRNPGNGLHILQPKFHGHQQTERCAMIHGEGLTVEVRGEQRLGMVGRRQVKRHEVRIRI